MQEHEDWLRIAKEDLLAVQDDSELAIKHAQSIMKFVLKKISASETAQADIFEREQHEQKEGLIL